MMSLLNVTVVRGKISAEGDHQQKPGSSSSSNDQHNTFLVLKLENVKSSTLPLKGADPVWNEEFLFETNKTAGVDLLVELWEKGLLWDNVVGYKLIQVDQLFQGQLAAIPDQNGAGGSFGVPPKLHAKRWFTLDADLLVSGHENPKIIGTKTSTPYMVLLDLRWELTSFSQDAMGGPVGDLTPYQTFENSCAVDNYNKFDGYGSMSGYGPAGYDLPDYSNQMPQQPYDDAEFYPSSNAAYNGYVDGDNVYHNQSGYDDKGYLMENSFGGGANASLESTFQDNNYSFYDNAHLGQQQQQQTNPSSCDTTKRPKLLPQVPGRSSTASNRPTAEYQQDPYRDPMLNYAEDNGSMGFSFEVYGGHPDPYGNADYAAPYSMDNQFPARPSRTRRKVLPSAPKPPPPISQYEDFESEPLSYNSRRQPPSKIDDQIYFGGSDLCDYDLNTATDMMNQVDQLNWKNLSQGNSFDAGQEYMMAPPATSKRKVLPQIPVQSKYGSAKSLPATPATSVLGLNGKTRKLPFPVTTAGIPTSTTTTGFSSFDHPYKSSLSEDLGDAYSPMMHPYETSAQDTGLSTLSKNTNQNQGKPSLLADMKSLFSKTSSSILPAMSSTLNNVSNSLASLPPSHVQHYKPDSVGMSLANEPEPSYDFMKSNKFEEASTSQTHGMIPDIHSTYYDDTENQLNNNFNMGVPGHYDGGYSDDVGLYGDPVPKSKMLPSVPAPQVPFAPTTSSATTLARNFFQSKNNATFHSTVENVSEEDPLSSSALNPPNGMKMSTNNSYELEDMSVDKSLYGSSFHTDIDEYDLIASGDIKQNFTYTDKTTIPVSSAEADLPGGVPLKTDPKSKLNNMLTDNDTVNNNNGTSRLIPGYGGASQQQQQGMATEYLVDDYSFNENADAYGGHRYEQTPDQYYTDYGGAEARADGEQYYDGYGDKRKAPSLAGMHEAGSSDYYYNTVEHGTVVGSNLEGIEELDEYERDEKEAEEDEDHMYEYDHYYNNQANGYKKGSLKEKEHEFNEEEEDLTLDDHTAPEHGDEDEELKEDHSKTWDASDDEIIGLDTKKSSAATVPTVTTTTMSTVPLTETMAVAPSPMSGISALMTSMAPAVVTQSSLSPASMLASGITTTLAANISNTITTTITGSPSIIFDTSAGAGDSELGGGGGGSSISKAMGSMVAGEGAKKMTPKQRWHHAYNKIIMQLNVSNHEWG